MLAALIGTPDAAAGFSSTPEFPPLTSERRLPVPRPETHRDSPARGSCLGQDPSRTILGGAKVALTARHSIRPGISRPWSAASGRPSSAAHAPAHSAPTKERPAPPRRPWQLVRALEPLGNSMRFVVTRVASLSSWPAEMPCRTGDQESAGGSSESPSPQLQRDSACAAGMR